MDHLYLFGTVVFLLASLVSVIQGCNPGPQINHQRQPERRPLAQREDPYVTRVPIVGSLAAEPDAQGQSDKHELPHIQDRPDEVESIHVQGQPNDRRLPPSDKRGMRTEPAAEKQPGDVRELSYAKGQLKEESGTQVNAQSNPSSPVSGREPSLPKSLSEKQPSESIHNADERPHRPQSEHPKYGPPESPEYSLPIHSSETEQPDPEVPTDNLLQNPSKSSFPKTSESNPPQSPDPEQSHSLLIQPKSRESGSSRIGQRTSEARLGILPGPETHPKSESDKTPVEVQPEELSPPESPQSNHMESVQLERSALAHEVLQPLEPEQKESPPHDNGLRQKPFEFPLSKASESSQSQSVDSEKSLPKSPGSKTSSDKSAPYHPKSVLPAPSAPESPEFGPLTNSSEIDSDGSSRLASADVQPPLSAVSQSHPDSPKSSSSPDLPQAEQAQPLPMLSRSQSEEARRPQPFELVPSLKPSLSDPLLKTGSPHLPQSHPSSQAFSERSLTESLDSSKTSASYIQPAASRSGLEKSSTSETDKFHSDLPKPSLLDSLPQIGSPHLPQSHPSSRVFSEPRLPESLDSSKNSVPHVQPAASGSGLEKSSTSETDKFYSDLPKPSLSDSLPQIGSPHLPQSHPSSQVFSEPGLPESLDSSKNSAPHIQPAASVTGLEKLSFSETDKFHSDLGQPSQSELSRPDEKKSPTNNRLRIPVDELPLSNISHHSSVIQAEPDP